MMHTFKTLISLFFFALTSCATSSHKKTDLEATLADPGLKMGKPLAILQSETSATQARFVVVLPDRETALYFLRTADGKSRALKVERVPTPGSGLSAVDQVEAAELTPKVTYELIVLNADGKLLDRREFRSLETSRHRARIALVSEAGSGHSAEQDKMWLGVASAKPDMLLLLGGGWGGLNPAGASAIDIWRQAAQARLAQGLYQFNPLVPTFATWNDQEYGKRAGDKTFAEKDRARDVFFAFFAQKNPAEGFAPGPGVASRLSAFGAEFILLDNRGFRSPAGAPPGSQAHFGPEQESWLLESLKDGGSPVFLGSGDQFFGGYHEFSSFEGQQPADFAKTLEEWRALKRPFVFLSGNRHLSEILQVPPAKLGYATFELTSGPMRKIKNKEDLGTTVSLDQVTRFAGEMSFVVLELIREERGFLQFATEIYGPDFKQEFQRTFTVKSL